MAKQKKPRKPMSPEVKEKLRENIAKARVVRAANRAAAAKPSPAPVPTPELPHQEFVQPVLRQPPMVGAVKTAEEVRAEAAILANTLVKDPDHFGRVGKTDPTQSPVQADFVPGTKPSDTLYIPDRVTEVGAIHSRQCGLPNDYKYAWVLDTIDHSKVMSYKNNGYKTCLYAGGSLSGLADRGFTNTDLFDNDRGRVRHGDLLLMWIEHRGWAALDEEEKKLLASWNQAATEGIHNEGYRRGVRTFIEEDGKQVF